MSLKIGVAGTGFIGETHLSCLKKIEGVKIAGIAERDEERRAEIVDQYGIDGFEDLSTMLERSQLDSVDICLPTPLHKQAIERSSDHVDSIICEKPIARSLSEAEEISRIAEEANLDLYVGHVLRFFPEYLSMKREVENGGVGKVGVVRTFRGGIPPAKRAEWYSNLEKSGRILVDMLIHDFDWLQWTIGEIDSVYTNGLSLKEGKRDIALVNVGFKSGTIGHVEGSWAHPDNFPFTTRVEIAGDEGLIDFDSNKSAPINTYKVSKDEAGGTGAPKSPLARNPWCLELQHFIDCMLNDEEPRVTLEDSVNALKVSLAALESLKRDEPINLGDFNEG
jgi:UDP-N-acetylglucosamine 3-dehydrogenase